MNKERLDKELVRRGYVSTRSQAEDRVRRGLVQVNGSVVLKPGTSVDATSSIKMQQTEQFVSRAGEKLASVVPRFNLRFTNKVVLDIGSSTGGFTDVALRGGAQKVIAVDVGTNQLHPTLRTNTRLELHEKTDIRNFHTSEKIDIVVADVSFISLRDILPYVRNLIGPETDLIVMVKPQFEASNDNLKHKGVIKNDHIRRDILRNFELWAQKQFTIIEKADSGLAGAKGNLERFYVLRPRNGAS